jgi:hypothetical protein
LALRDGEETDGARGGDRAVAWDDGRLSPSIVVSAIIRSTVTGTWSATACPVTSSTRRSAISWLWLRGSPAACWATAHLCRTAYVATPCTTGSSPVSRIIVSGAGLLVTLRSFAA